MAIVRWNPGGIFNRETLNDLENMRSQMMNLFEVLSTPPGNIGLSRAGVFPSLNMYEDEDKLSVRAEMPGIPAKDLSIVVENDKLIIRGERKISELDKKLNIHRQEREFGTFRRIVSLPVKVEVDKVTAVTKDGVLEITLPKAVEAKPRQITIQAI